MTASTSSPRSIEAKERRKRLFQKSRPLIRAFEKKDSGILWAAHKRGAFNLPELTQEQFLVEIAKRLEAFQLLWVVEDDCKQYQSGRGPIALVGIKSDGWVYEPVPMIFPWARVRHVLRASVVFFNMMWSKKEVGVCLVKAGEKQSEFLGHMKKYGVLYQRGRIPSGSPQGDVWIFSINGKRSP